LIISFSCAVLTACDVSAFAYEQVGCLLPIAHNNGADLRRNGGWRHYHLLATRRNWQSRSADWLDSCWHCAERDSDSDLVASLKQGRRVR
jgi:hypothetical protein